MTRVSRRGGGYTLLPDPEPRPVWCPVISVDDHLIEPPDVFEGRLPAGLADAAPKVVELDNGDQMWAIGERIYGGTGLSAVVGRPPEEWDVEDPARFDEMRPGCWNVHARIKDMDINGIWASICFPSTMAGFAGRVFTAIEDPALGMACVRAYNDWFLEDWVGPYPDRLIPLQICWLPDPSVAAADIAANAERGFRILSFPERPDLLGFPPIGDPYWEPILRTCEETGTVVCLHAGSSMWRPVDRPDVSVHLNASLFTVNSIVAVNDWIWSGIPLKHPTLKIALSEGGVGWVPMLCDRYDYMLEHSGQNKNGGVYAHAEISAAEALLRNFWFCSLDDPSIWDVRDRIGLDHIMLECDYPHADSTWPDTQALIERRLSYLPAEDVAAVAYGNASRLFGHPLPPPDFRGGEWTARFPTDRIAARSSDRLTAAVP